MKNKRGFITPTMAHNDIIKISDCLYLYSGQEYLVCTDSEANELWDEYLENYIEDCILPNIDENYRNYFDDEAWKSDARMDGRGHSLSSYDSIEHYEDVNGVEYYIYKQ